MASISQVVNISLAESATEALRDSMNVVAVMTPQVGVLSTANRYKEYFDLETVATDFGTSSAMYDWASTFFATSPNPTNANGSLVAGYWRAATETVAPTAAIVTGGQIDIDTVIAQMQSISAGSFLITIDAVLKTVTGLDFRTVTTAANIVSVINAVLTGGVASYSDGRFYVTSSTTGALSTITLVSAHTSGTFIGNILGLAAGTGATMVQGAAGDSLTLETKVEALTALKALINFKGVTFIDSSDDATIALIAAWAQTNDVLVYDVFSAAANLVVSATNVVWQNKLAGYTNYRHLFSKASNRKLAVSYMARMHTVNFAVENSALTMHLKELSVQPEEYTTVELSAAKTVGLDIYTTIKTTPVVLTSGTNDFCDNRYNLLAFLDAVQTDMFNLLKTTATKIPQTTSGINTMVDQAERTCREFVRAGVFAPGTWTSATIFGDHDTFHDNVENNGFYVLAGKLADQSVSDRNLRKSPIISIAVKNAGAVHSADLIVYFNR